MTEFKRALLSLTRRKGKTIILFAVIFIVGNVIAGAIAIQQASTKSEKQLKNALGSVATLGLDYDKIMNTNDFDYNRMPKIEEAVINELGQRPEVKSYDYNRNTSLIGTTQKRYEKEEVSIGGMSMATTPKSEGALFMLKGVQDHNVLDITDGKMDLKTGRVFTADEIKNKKNVALISEQFAEENNLTLGDIMQLKQDIIEPMVVGSVVNMDELPKPLASDDTFLEVVGIFALKPKKENAKDTNDPNAGISAFMDTEKLNTFYVPNGYIESLNAHEKQRLEELKPEADISLLDNDYLEPTFLLKSPDVIADFEAAVTPILPDFYKLSTSADEYKKIAGPIDSLQTMAKMTLVVAIGAGITILGLITMLFLRERRHEMGIYLSIGAPKLKIVTQIILEVVMIAIIAISASLVTGNILAKGISSSMIKNQQLSALENNSNVMNFEYNESMLNFGGDVSSDEAVETFVISMTLQYIIIFYLVGLGTIIISTLIPIVYFMRLKPKEIML